MIGPRRRCEPQERADRIISKLFHSSHLAYCSDEVLLELSEQVERQRQIRYRQSEREREAHKKIEALGKERS